MADAVRMSDLPAPDDVPAQAPDAPASDPGDAAAMAGPASRIWRYLPDGDPRDRAQRYLGEASPQERAQHYLTESQIRRRPSGIRPASTPPSTPPSDDAGRVASSPSVGGQAQSALHSMVAAVLEERKQTSVTPLPEPPAAFVAPAPKVIAEPAIVAPQPPAPDPVPPTPTPDPTPAPQPPAPDPEPPAPTPEPPIPGPGPPSPGPQIAAEEEELLFDEHGPVRPAPPAEPAEVRPAGEHLVRLRELSDRLRSAAVSPEGLQSPVDLVQTTVGADAVVLSLSVPRREQVTAGSTLGGGPRHAVAVRADGANVGELMACRLTDGAPFTADDETYLSLAADLIGALVSRAAAGSALEPGDQQFANTLAAEMRAPLGTVAGLVDDFVAGNAGALTDEQRGYLETAAEHTGRLMTIIRDLMTLSRLRRPESHEMDHIGVGPLLARAAASRAQAAQDAGVELSVEEVGEALIVKGVPEQLDRALGAIVENAIKFSPGGGHVTLSAEVKDGTVRITVADEGIGMDPSDTADVFERFARARTGIEAGIPGVGLGLNIVKEVVDVHAGRVWAESAPGHGTRVHLALPVAA